MRGAVPGRGRRQSAAPSRRSQRRPDRCATSLSPHPPSTPSLTSSLIYAAERGRKKARQTDRAPTLQHRCWPFFFPASGLCLPAFHSRLSRSPFNALGCCDESTDLPRNSAVIHFPRQRLSPLRVRRVSRTIYRVGSYQSFHIIPRFSVEGWFS